MKDFRRHVLRFRCLSCLQSVLNITKRRYEDKPYRLFVIFHDRKFVIFSDLAGAASAFSDMHQNVHQYFNASSCATMSSLHSLICISAFISTSMLRAVPGCRRMARRREAPAVRRASRLLARSRPYTSFRGRSGPSVGWH